MAAKSGKTSWKRQEGAFVYSQELGMRMLGRKDGGAAGLVIFKESVILGENNLATTTFPRKVSS